MNNPGHPVFWLRDMYFFGVVKILRSYAVAAAYGISDLLLVCPKDRTGRQDSTHKLSDIDVLPQRSRLLIDV